MRCGPCQGLPSIPDTLARRPGFNCLRFLAPHSIAAYLFRAASPPTGTIPGGLSPTRSDPVTNTISTSAPHERPRRAFFVAAVLSCTALLTFGLASQTHYRFHHLTVNDGLSQGSINAITQDSQGFLWFGSNDGLTRYDGYSMRVFQPDLEDSLAVHDHVISSLLNLGDRSLLVGLNQGGVRRLDLGTFRFESIPFTVDGAVRAAPGRVIQLFKDRRNDIWCVTPGSLFVFDSSSRRFVGWRPDGLGAPTAYTAISEDSDGSLWVSTIGRGLLWVSPDRSQVRQVEIESPELRSIDPRVVTRVLVDSRGILWVGLSNALLGFTSERRRTQNQRPMVPVYVEPLIFPHTILDDGGRIWFPSSALVLSVVDPWTGTAGAMRNNPLDPSSLSPGYVTALYRDRGGVVWVGTSGFGINRLALSEQRFPRLSHNAPLSFRSVRAIFEDRRGNLWIGGYGSDNYAGLDQIDAVTGQVRAFTIGNNPWQLSIPSVWDVWEDDPADGGAVWITSGAVVHRYDPATHRTRLVATLPPGIGGTRVIRRDKSGRMWVSSQAGLFRLLERPDRLVPITLDPARVTPQIVNILKHSEVWEVTELSATPGVLWCSTRLGLVCYDPDSGSAVAFTQGSGPHALGTSMVLSVHEDLAGRIWVGTGGAGFAVMKIDSLSGSRLPSPNGLSFERYSVKDGLSNDFVYGILDGGDGSMWMSTNRGLSRFEPHTRSFRNFDQSDGLQDNEFNTNAFLRSRRGELFFGGVVGLNRFHPLDQQDNPHTPEVVITEVKVLNKPLELPLSVSWLDEIVLGHEDRMVMFEYVGLEYTAPGRNRYRYKLEGFDQGWIDAGTSRSATYTNLEPGGYEFHVISANNDGVWNPVGASIRVVVEPPFWKTWWFRGFIAVVIVALLYVGSRLRDRRMKEQNRELEDRVRSRTVEWELANAELEAFSYTVSHDLRAPVRAINGYTRMLLEEHSSALDSEGKRVLGVIATRTKRMGDMIDDLLTFSRTGRQTIVMSQVDMGEIVRSILSDLLSPEVRSRLQLTQATLPSAHGDAALLRQVWINLISNALKFSGGVEHPSLEVGGRTESDGTVFWVRDNGVGFDMTYRHKLFGVFERLHSQDEFEGTGVGLAIAQRVVKRHGGRMWAESEIGKGATFSFFLPRG